jgi:hypothetical protein
LVSGYHLAFAVGTACVVVGIITAVAVLRRHATPTAVQPMIEEDFVQYVPGELEPQFERQAA